VPARIRNHIRSNVVGYVAVLLFAMSGTATALTGSNTVFSDDIVNGEVKTPDLATNAVTTGKIRNGHVVNDDLAANAVTGGKVEDGTLGGSDVIDASLSGGDLAGNTVTGDDIAESTLGQVPSALLGGFGRTGAEGTCDPESATFITCAATPVLDVPAGARALILARVGASTEGTTSDIAKGECRLGTSSIGAVPNTTFSFNVLTQQEVEMATLIGITPPLPAGATSFGIDCNQQLPNGAIRYDDASASVVLISGS
jgi:hypothetical protein